jgi:hypothetical protein
MMQAWVQVWVVSIGYIIDIPSAQESQLEVSGPVQVAHISSHSFYKCTIAYTIEHEEIALAVIAYEHVIYNCA